MHARQSHSAERLNLCLSGKELLRILHMLSLLSMFQVTCAIFKQKFQPEKSSPTLFKYRVAGLQIAMSHNVIDLLLSDTDSFGHEILKRTNCECLQDHQHPPMYLSLYNKTPSVSAAHGTFSTTSSLPPPCKPITTLTINTDETLGILTTTPQAVRGVT